MLAFSGATLPFEIMPPAVQQVAGAMPFSQGIQLMKSAFLGAPPDVAAVPLASWQRWSWRARRWRFGSSGGNRAKTVERPRVRPVEWTGAGVGWWKADGGEGRAA